MSEFLWLLLAAVVTIWIVCTAVVATLGVAAHRRDARVVIDNPHEQASQPQAWDRLREAVLQANADLERERADFSNWEREVRARRSRRAA